MMYSRNAPEREKYMWWREQFRCVGKVVVTVQKEDFWVHTDRAAFTANPEITMVEMAQAEIDLVERVVHVPSQIAWDSLLHLADMVKEAKKYLGG